MGEAHGRARHRGGRRAALPRRASTRTPRIARPSPGRCVTGRSRSWATASISRGSGSTPSPAPKSAREPRHRRRRDRRRRRRPAGGGEGGAGASLRQRSSDARRARFLWVGPTDDDKPDRLIDPLPGLELLGERARHARRLLRARRVRPAIAPGGLQPLGHGGGRLRPARWSSATSEGVARSAGTASTCSSSPLGDPTALTASLSTLIADRDLRRRLGEAAGVRCALRVRPACGGRTVAGDLRPGARDSTTSRRSRSS